jgi:hypothetical protein
MIHNRKINHGSRPKLTAIHIDVNVEIDKIDKPKLKFINRKFFCINRLVFRLYIEFIETNDGNNFPKNPDHAENKKRRA